MKSVVGLLILVLASSESPVAYDNTLKIGFNDVMLIIGGVFTGMGVDTNAVDIQPCVVDTGNMGDNVEIAAKDFLEKTYVGKMQALAHLGEAYKELPGFISKCEPAAVETAGVFERMVLAFKNPLSVFSHMGENLIVNGQDIFAEVSYAMTAWEDHDYFNFGFFCGQAGFKVLYVPPKPAKLTSENAGLMLNSLLKSMNVEDKACVVDSQSLQFFDNAFGKEKNFGGVLSGLRNLAVGLDIVLLEAEVCAGKAFSQMFSEEIKKFMQPTSVYLTKKMLIVNGADLSSFYLAAKNYLTSDYEAAGHYVAKALLEIRQVL